MYTILVTGVGSVIGYGIIDGLRRSKIKTKIIGIDTNCWAYGRYLCDRFVKGVPADSSCFTEFINKLISENNIDFVLTGIEQDLYRLWKDKEKLKAPVLMNNDLCLELAGDKYYTYKYLSAYDLPLIPTLKDTSFEECAVELGIPFLLKPIYSSASKGIEVIRNKEQFDFFTRQAGGKCIYQKIVGSEQSEYTVATFGNGEGGILDSLILRRTLSREGSTNWAETSHDPEIEAYCRKLVSILKPEGPLNIQVRKEEDRVYLLEINPRISSACSIRNLFGYNEPEMCLKYFLLHEPVKASLKKEGKVIRHINDYLIE